MWKNKLIKFESGVSRMEFVCCSEIV